MALERLTRISGAGISSELSISFVNGLTVGGGVLTATTVNAEIDSITLDTNSSGILVTGIATATSFVKESGTSSQFLKADGTVDSNTYLTAESDTLDNVTSRGNFTSNGISVGVATASSFVKSGGTSSQFLKADGTVDSNTYLTSETFTAVGIQSGGVSIGNATALNFVGSGNTFAVNGNTIDVSISGNSLTVKEVASQGGATNTTVSNVSEIQFNNGGGFNVTDEGGGVAFVDLGSSFKTWYIDGQNDLIAVGEDSLEIVAGTGIALTTKSVSSGVGTGLSKALTITATGGGGGGSDSGLLSLETDSGTTNVIGSIIGSDDRYQSYFTYWPSAPFAPRDSYSGLSSNEYYYPSSHTGSDDANIEFSFRIATGYQTLISGISTVGLSTSNAFKQRNQRSNSNSRRLLFADGPTLGIPESTDLYNRNTNYQPVNCQVMPIRNTGESDISVTVYYAYHSYGGTWSGSMVFSMVPENSSGTTYSTVNSVTYTKEYTGSTNYYANWNNPNSGNVVITVPAGKTILVGIVETTYYISTFEGYRYSAFTNLDDTFHNANIQCDLRMLQTMAYANFYQMGWTDAGWNSGNAYLVWNMCGTLYGDR